MANQHVAWIGLGNIGRGMVQNIAEKGPQSSLTVYNRTTSKAESFVSTLPPNKATVASSLPEAVNPATLIFTCVGDDPALDQIFAAILEAKDLDISGKTFVDCSTVHPDTSRKTQAALSQRGAAFVACPVFGAPNMAVAGQLVVVPAGSAEAIERARPYLDGVTARATLPLTGNEDVGRASLMKVLGNTFILNMVESLAEGVTAAEKTGLGAEMYEKWVATMFPGAFAKYAERMTSGDYHKREEPLFAVDLARKDLRHASTLASDGGMRLRSVEVTDGYLQEVKKEKGEKGDVAAVYGAIRKEAGLPFANN
ncbi:hypothetical protein SI65_06478 [Aspergillus cristatus]|uniref:6-phosphogluconate dehydrogenase NADP-binding domain-containing protein n=1 Tax=Aspergillus cristatus TaxID=573508 RepID=A0A1E3B9P1_ASPCR|nr:hypothetical protein SI65_06478 [Aspergillus cristatus]